MTEQPFHLTLSLTHRCDLRCRYCYAGGSRAETMSAATGHAAIRLGFETAGANRLVDIRFFGGEPLLEYPLMRHLTRYARHLAQREERPLAFGMTTNGTHLSPATLEWLCANRFALAVSVDGTPEMHDRNRIHYDGRGSSPAVFDRLKDALAHLPNLVVAMTVTPATAGELADGVRYLAATGVRQFEITPNYDACWDEGAVHRLRSATAELAVLYAEQFTHLSISCIDDKLARVLPGGEAIRCGFGETDLAVAPSGRIYPCERLIGEDRDRRWVIGTVADGLDANRRQWCIAQRRNAEPRCAMCEDARACRNACPCANLARTGRPDVTDTFICTYEQMLMRAAVNVIERVRAARSRRPPARTPSGMVLAKGERRHTRKEVG